MNVIKLLKLWPLRIMNEILFVIVLKLSIKVNAPNIHEFALNV